DRVVRRDRGVRVDACERQSLQAALALKRLPLRLAPLLPHQSFRLLHPFVRAHFPSSSFLLESRNAQMLRRVLLQASHHLLPASSAEKPPVLQSRVRPARTTSQVKTQDVVVLVQGGSGNSGTEVAVECGVKRTLFDATGGTSKGRAGRETRSMAAEK